MAKGHYKFKYIGDFKPSPNAMAIQKWKISAGFHTH